MFASQYRGRRVLVTGHTGFKGSWLCEWLLQLGAEVTGFSDSAGTDTELFATLGLASRMQHRIGDVRDLSALEAVVQQAQPDFVFHLAAQSLVRRSYQDPLQTFTTNVTGTAHLLDTLRRLDRPVACVVVTSDKCYENREVLHGYREDDALGGHDPYSASKGAAEIVTHAYRRAFFSAADSHVRIASARAGNVIGGGDWAEDRIVPDCMRSLARGAVIAARNPAATRPWQHVLEPLSGYLWLGALLTGNLRLARVADATAVSGAFNFGPLVEANRSVGELIGEILKHWPGQWQSLAVPGAVHEAGLLGLSIDKAFHQLQWHPVWSFARSVEATVSWYRDVHAGSRGAVAATQADIAAYMDDAGRQALRWARPD
jgi:CDP-glucose 4,6-dehydratase